MLDSDSRKPVVAALIRLIDDPSAKVRLEAVDSLGWIGPDASEALSKLQKLADEGDSSIKFSAAEALWFISMGAARGPLARHGKH